MKLEFFEISKFSNFIWSYRPNHTYVWHIPYVILIDIDPIYECMSLVDIGWALVVLHNDDSFLRKSPKDFLGVFASTWHSCYLMKSTWYVVISLCRYVSQWFESAIWVWHESVEAWWWKLEIQFWVNQRLAATHESSVGCRATVKIDRHMRFSHRRLVSHVPEPGMWLVWSLVDFSWVS